MGTVYLCEHAVLGRRFAVKVLRPDLVSDAELVDRFRNEAIAASGIGQENVVDVVDFGAEEDGALYYVMEALDGRSLGAVIRDEGPLPVARALHLLEQICRALAAAHARGVVHRDVKPDNVFLIRRVDGGEQVKVIDFGISHVPPTAGSGRITRAGAIIGTPEYMAPEQATGRDVDLRSDVYAAGVLAFEMLTGQLPIEAATPIATLVAHQTLTPDPPSRRRPGIPPAVDSLVLRALAKRPQDRHESMSAFASEVAAIRGALLRDELPRPSRPRGGTVSLPDASDVKRETVRRRRRRLAVAGGAALAAAALAGWWWRAAPSPLAPAAAARPVPAPPPPAAILPPAVEPPAVLAATPAVADLTGGAGRPAADSIAGTAVPAEPAPALLRREPAPPRRAKAARRSQAAPAGARRAPDDLKDPYSGVGELKDPFE